MKSIRICLLCVAILAVAVSCKKFEGEVTRPAYLALDSLAVNQQAVDAPSADAGWYTSDIESVQLIAYFAGDESESNLGTFQLPCRVPVLHEGVAEYVRVVPVIKQNGIAQTRVAYPYMSDTAVRGLRLALDSTTYIGQRDEASGRYWLPIYYKSPSLIETLVYEPFEPIAASIAFDTSNANLWWMSNSPDGARTGSGYLKVTTPDSVLSVEFPITESLTVNDPSKLLYLEMDYHTDVSLRIGIKSAYTAGGSESLYWAITLYPRKQYGKIYINLGRLWSQFNHYSNFHVVFSTLNTEGKGGDSYIDNLKIITL